MTLDQGMLFLLIALALVVIVLGGYLFYISRKGQAARLSLDSLDAHAPGKGVDTPDVDVDADVDADVDMQEEVQIK